MRKIVAIVISVVAVYCLLTKATQPSIQPASSRLFWFWAGCCLVLPAVIHAESMTRSFWKTTGEVILRSVIFLLMGLLGGIFIGSFFLHMLFGIDHDNAFNVGFAIAGLLAGVLTPDLDVLTDVLVLVVHGINKNTRGPTGGLCVRCHGRGICYECQGRGFTPAGRCTRCVFVAGQCPDCSGTGYGSSL